jgi:hypothetical protein
MNSIIYTVDGMQPMKEFLNFTSSVPACPILSHLIVPGSASCNGIASKNIQLVLLDAPQMPRAMPEMDAAAILGNHVIAAGMLLSYALALEDPETGEISRVQNDYNIRSGLTAAPITSEM